MRVNKCKQLFESISFALKRGDQVMEDLAAISLNDHEDGRYQRIKHFKSVKNELLSIKKSQTALAESVFNNIDDFSNQEERQVIILALKEELMEDDLKHEQKKKALSDSISEEALRLQHEIKDLIGVDSTMQGALIKKLSGDLSDVCEGHTHAMKILGNRFEINDDDTEMQQELQAFVNNIERAERTYQCLSELFELTNEITTTEEKLESLLAETNPQKTDRSIFAGVVDVLKTSLGRVREWKAYASHNGITV